MNTKIDIFIVEDDDAHLELIKRAFSAYNEYNLVCFNSLLEVNQELGKRSPDLLISDWKLPDGNGIELLPKSKERKLFPIILMTSYGNQELAVEAMKQGVIDYVVKSPEAISRLPLSTGRALREWDNIIAREKAEKALRESEKRYRALIESSQDVIFQIDTEANFMFMNSIGCKVMGVSKDEIEGKNISDYFQAPYLYYQQEAVKQILDTKTFLRLQIPLPFMGVLREYTVVLIPLFNDSEEIESIVGVCHDITEIIKTESALKQSEKKYREQSGLLSNILTHFPDYIYWKDVNLVYKGCNENYAREIGLQSAVEIIGKTDYDLCWDNSLADGIVKEEKRALSKELPLLHVEEEAINNQGKKIYISKNVIPLIDSEGNKAGILGIFSDITQRKKAEEELHKLSSATEQSPAVILITDITGSIDYVNPSFEKMTGYSFAEVKGKNPRLIQSGFTKREEYDELWATINAGKEWKGELLNKKKNGTLFWATISISAIKNEKGDITHFVAVQEDITEKKELEFELKRAVDRSEESSKLKSSLLSNMSHEIRTPLNGILGLSQILSEEISEDELKSMAKKIYIAGKRLMITLNSILELSELESNTTQINIVEYDINSQLNYLLSQYANLAKEKKLLFEIDVNEENVFALADERLCNQIIINLVDNAVKYTDSGSIKIITEYVKNDGLDLFKFSVCDTGIGIAKEDIPIIFDEFRQISEGYSRSFEGNGLGLTIAKKMLNLMNGKITVESTYDQGSTFSVYFPGILKNTEKDSAQVVKSKTKKSNAISDKRRPEILLVEDNIINKEVIACYINDFCNVDGVCDGQSAIDMAAKKMYDVILMDINLGSGIDGITATKEIRKFAGYERAPVVALTGYAMSRDKDRLLNEGLTHYLAKPFEKAELQRLLKSILKIE